MWSHSVARVARRASGFRTLTSSSTQEVVGWLFVDSVFPIRLGAWDFRHYIGLFREESLLGELQSRLSTVRTHGFKVLSVQPYQKDGGVFVKFSYNAGDALKESALEEIKDELRAQSDERAMPSWAGFDWGDVWLVRGQPWLEDMNRYPSQLLKVGFEGPDIQEEVLYELFRPYGRIRDVTPPKPVPAGTLRSVDVSFVRVRSAAIARNALHGYQLSDGKQPTRLQILYQRPIQAHVIRSWLTSHPRIVLPILFFLLGALTYTVFDPIRVLFVEGKMLNWFDYREYGLVKWLRSRAPERLSISTSENAPVTDIGGWKERREADSALRSYLNDPPLTIAFVHGPQGSGKSQLVSAVLQDSGRKTLVIDCAELNKATSDTRLVAALAQQTGYRPVFTLFNSLTNIIDIASMGVIGQKAGLSSSLTDQLKNILEVAGSALINVNRSLRNATKQEFKSEIEAETRKIEDARRAERIHQGTWHDGRIDCVAGNGIMSELGVGDEVFSPEDNTIVDKMDGPFLTQELEKEKAMEDELLRKERSAEEVMATAALPIVLIKNYGARGSIYREELQKVLSQWAATLVENKIAHVIVLSDNKENAKLITRALPSKPLNSIALYDADVGSSLSFVKQRLRDAGITAEPTKSEVTCIERLGGRASDLEFLIHKVRNGQAIEDAVEDIISRSVGELRKNAFGEDIEDAKALPWTREQAWTVLKQLAQKGELPYYDVLANFPFKGDELALRSMEHVELISITSANSGRPSTIRPGKPVFKYAFERLVNDPVFRATQDMAINDKLIATADNTIKAYETELASLKEIVGAESFFQSLWKSRRASTERRRYLLKKMYDAQMRILTLEKQNVDLKRTLAGKT